MKSICIPATPPVDIEPFLPIIDHPHFQKLRERKQLGINYLIFPGAVHTRFEHTLGVLSLTQRLCRIHGIDGERARTLQAFALLHDIGHGPFSHQIEPVLADDHHAIGERRILEMHESIIACGVSPATILEMLRGKHPDALWISDRNLGTDKLDYLMRDALHIGFHGTPDVERLQFNTHHLGDRLAIEAKYLEDAKQLQRFYSYLHQHGYLNKTALIAQRVLQRAICEELEASGDSGSHLWDMTDSELMTWLMSFKNDSAKRLIEAIATRRLPKTAIVIKPVGYDFVETTADKQLSVHEWQRTDLQRFCRRYDTPSELVKLENCLADELGCARGDILIAPMPYFRKLLPHDLTIMAHSADNCFMLLEKDIDHRRALESDYLRTFAIRITAPASLRQRVAESSERILPLLLAQ